MQHHKPKIFILTTILISLLSEVVFSDVVHTKINSENFRVIVNGEAWEPENFDSGTYIPATYVINPVITLDGKDDEPEWRNAHEVTVPLFFGSIENVSLKAFYTDEEVFIRLRWADQTENREHHPWTWDAAQGRYLAGSQIEDSAMLSFEAGCEWAPSLLEGYVYDFDSWQWLAARSDPLGQALDLYGTVQDQDFPALKFTEYHSRNSGPVWNMKFPLKSENDRMLHTTFDQLQRVYLLQPVNEVVYVRNDIDHVQMPQEPDFVRQLPPPVDAPDDEMTTFPQYSPLKLEGQAGEVSAKGSWEDGFWTVEFSRVRITPMGVFNDTVFNRLTQFSVYLFDQVDRLDQASESGRLFLQFLPADKMLVKK
jgi:hypothetical protein